MHPNITPQSLHTLYIDEQLPIGEIAKRLGCGHRVIKARLVEFGIPQRTPSEQKRVDLQRMSHDDRLRMTAASRGIITGKKRSHDDLCKRAQGKQRTAKVSGDEAVIMVAFNAAGMNPIPLFAVDKFNIDFAFPADMVAVEYHGGNWHNTKAKQAQDARKAAYLRAHGWTLLVFPRIDKPQANNAGNRRVQISEIMDTVRRHLKTPQ